MIDIFGITVFDGIGGLQLGALVLSYVVAFMIKGVFGYGAVPPMVLMGSLIMPPHDAVILAGLVNFTAQWMMVPEGLRTANRPVAGRVIVFILPALLVGVLIFRALPSDGLQLVVGVLLLGILLVETSPLRATIDPIARAHEGLFTGVASGVAGLMAGVVGAGAMIFLSVHLRMLVPQKAEFRGTVTLIVTSILVVRTLLLLIAGLITLPLVLAAALMLPVAAVALTVGRWLAGILSNEGYFRVYRWFMIGAALLLILRGLL